MCDQLDDVIELGTYVIDNMKRSDKRLKIMQKKFPKDIANIILQYIDCYKFIVEQIEYNYWVRIMPSLTSQHLYTHEIAFTKRHDHYVVMSTISSIVVRVNMMKHIVDQVNDWVDEINRRKHRRRNGMSCVDILLNRIGYTDLIICEVCQQAFPLDQARLLGRPDDRMDKMLMMCMQHNDQMIQMMYMYEHNMHDLSIL